jgi:hypothetical protein
MKNLIILIFVFNLINAFGQKFKEVPIQVLSPQFSYLNSEGGKILSLGIKQSTLVFDIDLPENTIRWFYIFTASRSAEDIEKAQGNIKLFAQLTRVIDQTGTTAKALPYLLPPPGSDYCNAYVLASKSDADKFNKEFNLKAFYYNSKSSRENFKSGSVDVDEPQYIRGRQYLGIHNQSTAYGLNVAIEVVAIVKEDLKDSQGWTKSNKENVFNSCLNILNYTLTSEDNVKEQICGCYTDEIVKKYSSEAFQEKPTYEVKNILTQNMKTCAIQSESDPNFKEPTPITTDNENNRITPTFLNMVGKWKAYNCSYFLNYDKTLQIIWNNGKITNGNWSFDGTNFICLYGGNRYVYQFSEYKPRQMIYKLSNTNQFFNATRIVNE